MKKDIKLPSDLAAKLSGLRDLKVLSQLHQQVDRSSSLASKRWRKGHTESDGFLIFSLPVYKVPPTWDIIVRI